VVIQLANVVFEAIWSVIVAVYDATFGALMRFIMDVIETILFWAVPELPSQAIQTQWNVVVCILALCAILYATVHIVFTDKEEIEFNFRYFFLGVLFMRGGLELFRDMFMIVTAACTAMLSTFENPVSAFFHLLAGGVIATLASALPIILYLVGIAIQIFIALIGGYILCIAGVYYIIPLVSFKEKGDAMVRILIGDLGIAIINSGLFMLTIFASSGAGINIISRFLLGLGYICVMVIVMYKIIAWSMSDPKYERTDILQIALIPNKKKSLAALKKMMRW